MGLREAKQQTQSVWEEIFNAKHVGKRTLRAMKVVGSRNEGGREGGFGFPNWKREESFLIHLQARKVGPHRGINNSAKSGFETPSLINLRFSQDVKEVMR